MIRQAVSLTLCLSGICLIITSVVLCIAPPTHVGHFSSWRLLGLGKCQWNALHIMTGLLFVIALLPHAYYNRRPIAAYLKSKKNTFVLATKPMLIALLLTAYTCVGAVQGWPPMGQIAGWLGKTKLAHVRNYGTPPFGPAKSASLKNVITYMGWDVETSLRALRQRAVKVLSGEEPLMQVARNNNTSIGRLMDMMDTAAKDAVSEAHAEQHNAPTGVPFADGGSEQ